MEREVIECAWHRWKVATEDIFTVQHLPNYFLLRKSNIQISNDTDSNFEALISIPAHKKNMLG